jgi:hypothetical protein
VKSEIKTNVRHFPTTALKIRVSLFMFNLRKLLCKTIQRANTWFLWCTLLRAHMSRRRTAGAPPICKLAANMSRLFNDTQNHGKKKQRKPRNGMACSATDASFLRNRS